MTWFYLPMSILVLILTMAPFFLSFEHRKPRAREVVLIAVCSAITVVLHLFFHVVLPVQIGTALVIIFGVALGPEAGFIIGALSRFVCNFYMGQGMWTPWQMFCWGLLGFLAGYCFNSKPWKRFSQEDLEDNSEKSVSFMAPLLTVIFSELICYVSFLVYPGQGEGSLYWRVYAFGGVGIVIALILRKRSFPKTGLILAIFTFITTIIIYGGIMNFAALVTGLNAANNEVFSSDALMALYVSGLPYDVMHGGTAALCVYLMGESMIAKLDRIKIKYGIYKPRGSRYSQI